MNQGLSAADEAAFQAADAAHHLHPFTDHQALAAEGARVIVRAEGCTLWDSRGTAILDGMAGLWCVNVGYGRRELADAAARQMRELPYYNTFFKTTTPPATELAARLAGQVVPATEQTPAAAGTTDPSAPVRLLGTLNPTADAYDPPFANARQSALAALALGGCLALWRVRGARARASCALISGAALASLAMQPPLWFQGVNPGSRLWGSHTWGGLLLVSLFLFAMAAAR